MDLPERSEGYKAKTVHCLPILLPQNPLTHFSLALGYLGLYNCRRFALLWFMIHGHAKAHKFAKHLTQVETFRDLGGI